MQRSLGCNAYLRYVDDYVLFSNDKKQLWEWRTAIIERLAYLRLAIHEECSLPRPVTDGMPFLGFVVFPTHRLLKRRKGIAYCRRLKKIMEAGSPEKVKSSVQGWVNHVRYGDTYGLRTAVLEKYNLLEMLDG